MEPMLHYGAGEPHTGGGYWDYVKRLAEQAGVDASNVEAVLRFARSARTQDQQ